MWGNRKRALLSAAFLSAANFLAWLGWDRERTRGSDGYIHGPYETWQVVGVIVVLGAIAVVSGFHGRTVGAAWASAMGMAVAFVVAVPSGDPGGGDNGLAVVGAVFLAIGTFFGFWIVASAGQYVSRSVGQSVSGEPAD